MRLNRLKKGLAAVGAAAIALVGVAGIAATPAHADPVPGPHGEMTGLAWKNGENWEGTYQVYIGGNVTEVYCAGLWDNYPSAAEGNWTGPRPLEYVDGGGLVTDADQAIIANAVNQADAEAGKAEADVYAAAASIVVHTKTLNPANPRNYPWDNVNEWPNADQFGQVRELVGELLDYEPLATPLAISLDAQPVLAQVGKEVALSGRVTDNNGAGVGNWPVDIAINGQHLEQVRTGSDGSFNAATTMAVADTAAELNATASSFYNEHKVQMMVPLRSDGTPWPGSTAPSTARPQNVIVVDGLKKDIAAEASVGLVSLGTLAAVTGNDDNVISFRGAEVVDTLYFENFEAGVQYNVSGELMWKKYIEGTDGEFEAVSTGITGSTSFTPEGEEGEFVSGTAQVKFNVTEEDAVQYLGETLVVFEYVSVDGEEEPLASHEDIYDEDQSVYVAGEEPPTPSQELKTDARLQHDGDKVIPDSGGVVVDTVTYEGLRWDREYTVKGELMLVVDGVAEGTGITAEKTFTPETDYVGTVEVEFVVSAEMAQQYAGQSLVVFEYVYDAQGELLAEHTDPNSAEQTTYVADLGTMASVAGNDDKVVPSTGGTVVDAVAYTNFKSGTEYTVSGELMVAETGEATGIVASATFTTPESDSPVISGTVDVEFELTAEDAATYRGATLVVFERAYEVGAEDPTAVHEDLTDEAQTVFVSGEEPPTPPTPEEPEEPKKPGGELPKTGSNAAALGLAAMGLIALGGAAVAIRKRLL